MESVEVNMHFKEDQQQELADAFGAKRVGEPPGGDAATLPEERGGCSDNSSKGSGIVFGAAVRAWKQVIALKEVLAEGIVVKRVECSREELLLPVWERAEMF